MGSIPKILAIIPARGGSKGVPGKNIKPLAGKPLIAYTIAEAKKSKYIDRLVVSTEDEKIAVVAKQFEAEVIDRPAELAQDESPTPPVLRQAVEYLEATEQYLPDLILLLTATCPLRKAEQIDGMIEKYLAEPAKYDCLIGASFVLKHRYEISQDDLLVPVTKDRSNRQERKPVILENGSMYLSSLSLIRQDQVVAGKIGYYQMGYGSSVNIDEPIDFLIAEQLILEEQRHEV